MSDDKQFFQERPESNFLVQVIQRYLPFWPLFVVTTAIGLFISYILLRSEPNIYMASAKVLLKDPQKNGGDSKVLDALNIFSEKKIVENEIIVLQSSSLMEEVVRTKDLYAQVYNEGKVTTGELYGGNSPIFFYALNRDSIEEGGKYYFSVNWKNNTIDIAGQVVPFNGIFMIGRTSYHAVPNESYNKNLHGKNYYVVFHSVSNAAAMLIGSLKLNATSKTSTVIDVKMETPVAEKGVDVLTRLFEVYNAAAIEDKNQIAAKTLAFIEDRLLRVNGQLDSVRTNILAYKKKEGVYNLGGQAELYLSNVKDLDKQNGELEMQLGVLNDISDYVNQKGKKPGTVPSLLLVEDPTLSNLLGNLYQSEFSLDKLKASTGEKSDAVILAEQSVERIRGDIKENITNYKNNLFSVKNKVNSKIGQNSGMLSNIPQKEMGLLDISRQEGVKTNIVNFLLQKREETALSSASTSADLRVLEKANASGPIKPVHKTYYLAGLLLGLLAAIIYVFLREQFNSKILFRSEIEQKTKVPVVAEIVQTDTKEAVAIADGKRTIIAEQLRSLRTNLSFIGLNDEQKTLLVTSSISGEGKSFIAINLAMSITLTGKKVALMELDLRKPKLSKYLNVNRDPGISNYLIGKAAIKDIIKETKYPNLFIVSAGPIPPNPTELINSNKFGEMISELKEMFDYIIIDSAPLGPVTDSQLLGKYADTTLFVIRHGLTPKVFLRMIDDLYQQKKFKNMCLVFNGIKKRGLIFNNYGYGYTGYGYGYTGYGYYVNDKEKPALKNLWGFTGWMRGLFGKK